ncbi:hypothetical protein D3C72_2547780 [compost metagenome]
MTELQRAEVARAVEQNVGISLRGGVEITRKPKLDCLDMTKLAPVGLRRETLEQRKFTRKICLITLV